MGVSRYSPEGLPPEDFPLDMRYRINALYKLAMSSFHAGKYEDTLKFLLKALEKNPHNENVLELLGNVQAKVPEMDYSKFSAYLAVKNEKEEAGIKGEEDIVSKIAVKSPVGQRRPRSSVGVDTLDEAVRVLKPKVMKPRLVKGGKVSDSILELARKAKYNPPPEVSDLFDFDDIDTLDEPRSNRLNGDETPDQKRAKMTASVIEKLRAGKGKKNKDNSELRRQIRMQLDQFKGEGFLVSRVEKMMSNRSLDTKVILDELIVISSQIEMLKDLKKRADVLEETPGANKAKLMTLKLRLSDPDRISEIIKEIEQMESTIPDNEHA